MAGKAKMVKYEGTVAEAVSYGFALIQELADEVREAYDNTPESLQNSGAGEMRGIAADELEQITEIDDIPDALGSVAVRFEKKPLTRGVSRAARRDDATFLLGKAIEALEAQKYEEIEALEALEAQGREAQESDDDNEEAAARDELVEAIQQMIDDAEAVEFPGMYG